MPEQPAASSVQEVEFREWMLHPTTKRLLAAARERRQAVMEEWAAGAYTAETADGTIQRNAKGIARCQELSWLVEIEFMDLYEEMESAAKPSATIQGLSGG